MSSSLKDQCPLHLQDFVKDGIWVKIVDEIPMCTNCGNRAANHPRTSIVNQPVSPRLFESCFVIVDGTDVVAGSAFAVSPSLLISAMHVFEDNVDFFACQDIKRDSIENIKTDTIENTISYPDGKYQVKVVAKGDANVDTLDFVVLQLSDPTVKQLKYLPIATQVEKGEHVRLYSAFNAPGFNDYTQDFCNIAIDTSVQLISTISGSHIYCSKGSEDGNSGGPYINSRGEVVAIHTMASNNIPDIEKSAVNTTKKAKLLVADVDAKVANVTAKVVELCDVVSRISNTHTSHSIGLMIKNCPRLCAYLRSNGVNM